MDDQIFGKIIAKRSIHILGGFAPDWYPNFTLKVSFKDGRYKAEIIDISITTGVRDDSSETTNPFSAYFNKKEYYKNTGDPEWRFNNPIGGVRIGKAAAKAAARPNQGIYNLICKTESEMKDLLSKLHQEMLKTEDDW